MRFKREFRLLSTFVLALMVVLPLKGFAQAPRDTPAPLEVSSLFSAGLEGYQKLLSPVLDSQCYMLPSCSEYAKQAVSDYGPLLGLLLTVDRLFHEANEDQTSPVIKKGGQIKLYDPPSANVWWK